MGQEEVGDSHISFFSSHDSEQARGGRGGFQQRDIGPPDQVLGIYSQKCL